MMCRHNSVFRPKICATSPSVSSLSVSVYTHTHTLRSPKNIYIVMFALCSFSNFSFFSFFTSFFLFFFRHIYCFLVVCSTSHIVSQSLRCVVATNTRETKSCNFQFKLFTKEKFPGIIVAVSVVLAAATAS